MRFMLMHKTNASNEAGLRPPEELIAGVDRTIREMQETGIFRDGAGLRASSLGARLELHGAARTVTPGPFTGKNELPANRREIASGARHSFHLRCACPPQEPSRRR
jgi:PhnB protein